MKKLILMIISIIPLAAWIYAIMDHLGDKEYIMLVIAAVIPPVGVIDGIGLYLGAW